jgi:hypothetical protein
MREDERVWAVKDLLFDYLKSPSLRHIRDPHSITRLAQEIVRRIDRGNSIWQKWDGQRELLLKSALCCWIPVADMRGVLNGMPGQQLTMTDVAQRLKALEEEEHYDYPREELQAGCLVIYENEKAEGTELPAIIQVLRDYVEKEEDRLTFSAPFCAGRRSRAWFWRDVRASSTRCRTARWPLVLC